MSAALKDLLYRLADDKLIGGHRSSEWTGIGPLLEEDIAFASMAQDEIGHALAYYKILEDLGEGDPDQVAFTRQAEDFYCCQLVEQPIGDYAFSLMRHFLFTYAEKARIASLRNASYRDLAELTRKIEREVKYHQLHARTWIMQLGAANAESNQRLQTALNAAMPLAYGIFEPTTYDAAIASEGLQAKEADLEAQWLQEIAPVLEQAQLQLPHIDDKSQFYGGRKGRHSEHLQPLLSEMTEVFVIDPTATW